VLIRSLAQVIEDAKADGVVDWFDVPKLGRLKEFASDALKGSQNIPAELLDLDAEEIKILATALIEAISKIIEAVRK
jgi:hypothetical protein